MNRSAYSNTDIISFTSMHPLTYGQNVTILDKPVKQNGQWVTNALLSSSVLEKIYLPTKELQGSNFAVLQTQSQGKIYSHTAILLDQIDKVSQSFEDNIIRILNSM